MPRNLLLTRAIASHIRLHETSLYGAPKSSPFSGDAEPNELGLRLQLMRSVRSANKLNKMTLYLLFITLQFCYFGKQMYVDTEKNNFSFSL